MIGSIGLFDQKLASGNVGGTAIASGKFAQASDGIAESSFGQMLSAAATRTVDALSNAEDLSVKGIQGGADTRQVVDAVMNAEQALQAAVAIRDKIVSAYLDISRMAI